MGVGQLHAPPGLLLEKEPQYPAVGWAERWYESSREEINLCSCQESNSSFSQLFTPAIA